MKRASNCFNCAHFAPVNWTGKPTVCSIGHKPRYFMSPGGKADWHNPDRWGWKRRCEDFQSKPKVIVEPGYATRRHPGYIMGEHWLQAAYTRICTGETEAEVMADYGWQREA